MWLKGMNAVISGCRRRHHCCRVLTTLALTAVPETSQAQWTFAGYVGEAWTSPSTITIDDASVGTSARVADVEYESRSWSRPLYWGVRASSAIAPGRHWAVEFEYIHLKLYATPEQTVRVEGRVAGRTLDEREPFRAVVERFQLSHGLNLLMMNAAFEQRVHPRLALAARAGLGPTLPHVEATVNGTSRDEYTWGGIGLQAGGSVNWFLTPALFLTGELKRTFTHQRLAVGSAKADARFATTHLIAGVGVRLPVHHAP